MLVFRMIITALVGISLGEVIVFASKGDVRFAVLFLGVLVFLCTVLLGLSIDIAIRRIKQGIVVDANRADRLDALVQEVTERLHPVGRLRKK